MNDKGDSIQREGLSITEACEVAGVGRTRLYAAIAAGELLSRRFGKRRIVLSSPQRFAPFPREPPHQLMKNTRAALPAARVLRLTFLAKAKRT
jgi:excisionase family DNA binding protein